MGYIELIRANRHIKEVIEDLETANSFYNSGNYDINRLGESFNSEIRILTFVSESINTKKKKIQEKYY